MNQIVNKCLMSKQSDSNSYLNVQLPRLCSIHTHNGNGAVTGLIRPRPRKIWAMKNMVRTMANSKDNVCQ